MRRYQSGQGTGGQVCSKSEDVTQWMLDSELRAREVEEGKQVEWFADRWTRVERERVELNLFTIITLLHCVYINKVGFVR